MPDVVFDLGRHEANIEALLSGQTRIFERLGAIERSLAERRGERRVASILWGGASGLVGAVAVILTRTWLGVHA